MADAGELYTGRTLGRYELLVPLAQGATASVWAARTTGSHLEKIVAVKVMLADADADMDAESMFLDEARLVSRIRHPNVASLLEFGEDDDLLYIVIEWVEGEPLQVVLREAWASAASAKGASTTPRGRGVPLPFAVRLVEQAAAGLHAAHDLCDEGGKPLQIVHRDVSPANILAGYDGSVKVIDFGIAKAVSNVQSTRIGQIKGKVAYMAPEQALGDQVDRRTDVFALGLVLYQLVTGKHPFRGDNEFATLARIRDPRPAEAPRVHMPEIPPALEEVMLQAIAKPRDARFASMLEFGRALERVVPSPPDIDRALGSFVGELLSQRAAKRQQAIKDALRAVGERSGTDARPVNFGNKPIYDDAADDFARRSAGTRPAEALPAPAGVSARATGPASAAIDPGDLPEGMRPTRSRAKLVAAGVALVVVLMLALWAIGGGASSAGDTGETKHAF